MTWRGMWTLTPSMASRFANCQLPIAKVRTKFCPCAMPLFRPSNSLPALRAPPRHRLDDAASASALNLPLSTTAASSPGRGMPTLFP